MLTNDEIFTFLACSVRYALGRSTYVVADVAGLAVKYAPMLTQDRVEVIKRDIRKELQEAESRGQTLGMKMDHEEWTRCLEALEASPPNAPTV